jgi:GNAT superfamily N-acetyltransferase
MVNAGEKVALGDFGMNGWRGMRPDDLDAVLAVADVVHPALPESRAVFAERLTLFPRGCLVLAADGAVGGYAVSHPIRRFAPPALDTLIGTLPADADDYYIHDVAIRPEHRRGGAASIAVGLLLDNAREYATSSLVAVYGSAAFWSRFGFVETTEVIGGKLAPYGPGAVYMLRPTRRI